MGMKHLTDYTEEWSFARKMWYQYQCGIPEEEFWYKRLDPLAILTMDLFYFPSEYKLWFFSPVTLGLPIRKNYPICYLVAKNDVIPIKVSRDSCVLLQNPAEFDYVMNEHRDTINTVLRMISDYWLLIRTHYEDQIDESVFLKTLSKATECGWRYDPRFLEKHPLPENARIIT